MNIVDKALVALIMAIANIVDLIGGSGWWSHLVEEEVGIALNVLTPIFVWLMPNGFFTALLTRLHGGSR